MHMPAHLELYIRDFGVLLMHFLVRTFLIGVEV